MVCEITDQTPEGASKPDLLLMMQCPRCIMTHHRPPEETIMHIRQSNRMWHLDQRTKQSRALNPILHTLGGSQRCPLGSPADVDYIEMSDVAADVAAFLADDTTEVLYCSES